MNAEQLRVERNSRAEENWDFWGPYLSERAWGTVREDYSANGTAWDYFPHDHARSRAFRGAKTASPVSAITSSDSPSRFLFGMGAIRF